MYPQTEKALRFQALHQATHCFVMPNPWDVGSARLLAALGFPALASTGAGLAFSLGVPDYQAGPEMQMAYLTQLAAASHLPISADLEDGGETIDDVYQTILKAAESGVVGGSIEDSVRNPDQPLRPIGEATERVRAAVAASRTLAFPFMVTARAENYFCGRPDLHDTIARLQAYQEAGADVLFAPGLRTKEDVASVLQSIDRPLNVLMGFPDMKVTLQELQDMGVRRVSLGGTLARVALGAVAQGMQQFLTEGTCAFAHDAVPGVLLNQLFASQPASEKSLLKLRQWVTAKVDEKI